MQHIGFVGVGRMATPLVPRFVERGWHPHLFDVRGEATAGFRLGPRVTVHDSVAALLAAAEVVLLNLPDGDALLEVVDAIASAPGVAARTIVNTTTCGPAAARQAADALCAAGHGYVDAPVSGGSGRAERGALSVIVAGPEELIARCRPMFDVLAEHVHPVGTDPQQAQAMKLANNMLSLGAILATAEATAVTTRAGIPLEVALDVLNVSSGRNSSTDSKFPEQVVTGRFDFGFPITGALKDMSLFLELARELGLPSPLAEAEAALYRRGIEHGYGAADCTRMALLYAHLAEQR